MDKQDKIVTDAIIVQLRKYCVFKENTTLKNNIDFIHINIMLHAIMKSLVCTHIIEDYIVMIYRRINEIEIRYRTKNMTVFTKTKINMQNLIFNVSDVNIYVRLEKALNE